jgi:hypothetical protein
LFDLTTKLSQFSTEASYLRLGGLGKLPLGIRFRRALFGAEAGDVGLLANNTHFATHFLQLALQLGHLIPCCSQCMADLLRELVFFLGAIRFHFQLLL